jgi:tRNA (guanine37-N1)-methyltransferase
MRIDLITLFPEMCEAVMGESIIGRARKKGALTVCCHQLRDYTYDKHNRVDDVPYGGGMGMLLLAEPIADCFEHLCAELGTRPRLIYMSPQGSVLNQEKIKELAQYENIAILCGHYEGVDERVLDEYVDEQISIGDFVLTGGELPGLMLADALSRMAPGVLADDTCFEEESHYDGLLEYPQYTRPAVWRGREVPEVLLSGHHANIRKWRREQSLLRTALHRPDLLDKAELTDKERRFLEDVLSAEVNRQCMQTTSGFGEADSAAESETIPAEDSIRHDEERACRIEV